MVSSLGGAGSAASGLRDTTSAIALQFVTAIDQTIQTKAPTRESPRGGQIALIGEKEAAGRRWRDRVFPGGTETELSVAPIIHALPVQKALTINLH